MKPVQSNDNNTILSQFGYQQELKRTLSLKDLTIYGIIFMAPLAPMQVYGMVAQESIGMSCLVYLIGVIAMLFTAYSYSHMSKEFPISGSVYSYIQRALNPHLGFIAGWIILADYILAPALLYLMTSVWMTGIFPNIPSVVWAFVFIAINTLINIRGITLTAKTNLVMLYMQLATLLVLLIIGIKYVFIDGNGAGGFTLDPFFRADNFSPDLLAKAASIAVLGFLGFDGISTLSEEAKDPTKTIGKATILSIIIIGILFMFQAYIAHLIHPDYQTLNPEMGFFDLAKEAGGSAFYVLLIIINVVAIGIAVNLNLQAATSRILYSMSRDNLLPFSSLFKEIHPQYQTPVRATFLSAGISAITVLTLSIETVLRFVNFGAVTSFMLLNLSVFLYFYVIKKKRSGKALLSYLIMPLIGFLIVGYVWTGFDETTFTAGAAWVVIGIIIGAVKSKRYKEVPPSLKALG
ncbi:APC family permease [Sporomusa malonica]|uniref:Amino acid transporter n=1 Tax=Sporomusa malonica TaxID=112901 RepID=A0A1W2CWT0_9FIRM|nr:APC family permease [Sporomusa malonica]SMC89699.1 Amino acid transporter [Sporomusa malonica]